MDKKNHKNIFLYNILKSTKCNLGPHYSHLHSLLIHYENEIDYGTPNIDSFAEKILMAINMSNAFINVDRVCIALSFPQSSKIKILSSAVSEKIKMNPMVKNYSCFIRRDSSLIKTKKGEIRFFSDIDDIVSQYQDPSQIQRSLKYLKEMGIKSGIAIPIPISGLLSGIIFFNSVDRGQFDYLNDEDYSTLCLLKIITTSALQKVMQPYHGLDGQLLTLLEKLEIAENVFTESVFKEQLLKLIKNKTDSQMEINIVYHKEKEFFISYKPLYFMMMKILESSGSLFLKKQLDLEFKIEEYSSHIELKVILKNTTLKPNDFNYLHGLKFLSEIEVIQDGQDLILKTISEFKMSNVDYSV